MPTIRLHSDVEADLIALCGKIQILRNRRASPSTAISLLFRFTKQHQAKFDAFIEMEKELRFPKDYNEKIGSMRDSGIPTTQDLKKD